MPERSKLKQHSERAVPDEAAAILAAGKVAHLGFVQDGQPFVIPLSYHYDPAVPDRLYLHGSESSRALLHVGAGMPVCVEVTLLDGLVYSRSALYHSMNYRSVVCFGRARPITDAAEKEGLLARMIARYFPGRSAGRDYQAPPADHLGATQLVEITIEEWSAKARRGGPKGPLDAEPSASGTCGTIDFQRPE